MADINQKQAAKKFVEEWRGRGQEDEDCRSFWIELAESVLGIETPTKLMSFEKKVKIKGAKTELCAVCPKGGQDVRQHRQTGGSTKRIDVYIPSAKVMIEQKSINIDLDKPQQGHDGQTPFQQACFYNDKLNYEEKVRWIIVSNFKEIRIHDMNDMQADPLVIMLDELPEKLSALDILKVEKKEQIKFEEKISVRAGEITGKLYDALIKQYANPDDEETLRSLNQLCVRLVFCLYAEDAGIFGDNQFHDYIASFNVPHIRVALKNLFKILDTPDSERDPDDEPNLLAFPYVNGGLFKDETIRIPQFNEEIKALLLDEASQGIDWSDISPTIFGAVFESTLNPDTRRSGGMHYTSVENIHKVIDSLFLDDLRAELDEIKALKQGAAIAKRVEDFQKKLSELVFLDPACGSGNFLTETYLSLRRLENEALAFMHKEQIVLDSGDVIKVSIGQFNGIEINDFAVTVAKTALWIAESQMMHETEQIVLQKLNFLPLKTDATIVEGNALRLDWSEIVPLEKLSYIMGNPPFVGARRMTKEQHEEITEIFSDVKNNGNLDYVCAWYKIAAEIIKNTNIRVCYISTNSISEGEQVSILWKYLFDKYNISINFAYPTFLWTSETKGTASVHCVIIGFSNVDTNGKKLYYPDGNIRSVEHINGYLLDAPDMWIEKRNKPLCKCPAISNGSKPLDNAICAFTPEEMEAFIKREPNSAPYFFRYMGSKEFINSIDRRFLLINRIPPHELKKMPAVLEKLEEIREYRRNSDSAETKKLADTPAKFHYENMPDTNFLVIPQTSSGRRKYVPIGFLTPDILVNNKLQVMREGTLYELGVLSSSVHNSWLRCVAGRLRNDFTYSVGIVYNNFVWCTPTEEQRRKIEETAKSILDVRDKFEKSSLADLYDDLSMPDELRKAHKENDKAVLAAYGLPKNATESEIVAFLFKKYAELTNGS